MLKSGEYINLYYFLDFKFLVKTDRSIYYRLSMYFFSRLCNKKKVYIAMLFSYIFPKRASISVVIFTRKNLVNYPFCSVV